MLSESVYVGLGAMPSHFGLYNYGDNLPVHLGYHNPNHNAQVTYGLGAAPTSPILDADIARFQILQPIAQWGNWQLPLTIYAEKLKSAVRDGLRRGDGAKAQELFGAAQAHRREKLEGKGAPSNVIAEANRLQKLYTDLAPTITAADVQRSQQEIAVVTKQLETTATQQSSEENWAKELADRRDTALAQAGCEWAYGLRQLGIPTGALETVCLYKNYILVGGAVLGGLLVYKLLIK